MAKTYLIGVDLGTMGTKTAIFDSEGNLVAEAYEESRLYYPKPGWVEQNPDEIYASAVRTIRQCLEESGIEPGSVAGIAFDSQMAGIRRARRSTRAAGVTRASLDEEAFDLARLRTYQQPASNPLNCTPIYRSILPAAHVKLS